MYDIRQFKPALYLVLTIGFSGFALAAQSPGFWAVSVVAVGLNAALVAMGRFRPMPRLLANTVTLLSLAYIAQELFAGHTTPVLVIGQFLVLLQLVKLWEQRANRDYAQLLVLSLLLMVAASINTASLWFGILMVIYLFLSLYCCLLFHLKAETDSAREALGLTPDKVSLSTVRQDQRYLSQSMRKLTAFASVVAIAFAVVVFLFFPRGSGGGILGQLQLRGAGTLVGFSDEVNFQSVARIQQNHEKVAWVQVWQNGKEVTDQPLLLRGVTLDTYRRRYGGAWRWTRSPNRVTWSPTVVYPDSTASLVEHSGDVWKQEIMLSPTRTNVLFAMAGPVSVTPHSALKLQFSPGDGILESLEPIREQISYQVESTNSLDPPDGIEAGPPVDSARIRERFPKIYQYARRPAVSGTGSNGSLAEQRGTDEGVSPLDEQIASNIADHLRTTFAYTLDLTDEKWIEGREPLEAFLYDWKKGHCEYFAGAMTLMCQSLGMQARMVVGFKCDPPFNGVYTVHQSDAHAWCEVRTTDGWKTFDPTSSREVTSETSGGLLGRFRRFIDYIEYAYAKSVIAYDNDNRDSLVSHLEARMSNAVADGARAFTRVPQVLEDLGFRRAFWNVSSTILSGVVLLMLTTMVVACLWFLWERWLLRRRAARIGIESLPESEQLRLARQLRFYDDLVRLLDRHRIPRPRHLTPREFSQSLLFLPADVYQTILRLTELFYRVRYGGVELTSTRQRRLGTVLDRLSQDLART